MGLSITKHTHEVLHDRVKIARRINRRCHTRNGRYRFNPKGTAIFDEEWDNLIILDACRYDAFKRQADLPGRLEVRQSLGPATYRWVKANFSNQKLHNTVYVSANSWYIKLKEEINSELHSFIDLQSDVSDAEWVSEQLNVVTPGTVTKYAKQASDNYPNKRLIIHYLQPHHPFIGPNSQKYFTHQSNSLLDVVRSADKDITQREVRQAYNETLAIVLDEVTKLLPELSGRTVITADHGEMLGDRHDFVPMRDYGHHRGIYNEPTVKVPWHIVNSGPRKKITSDEPVESDPINMTQINDQLKDLGYKL
jgi:hypothetical protein